MTRLEDEEEDQN